MSSAMYQRGRYFDTRTGKWAEGPCGKCGKGGDKGKMYSNNNIIEIFGDSVCGKCYTIVLYLGTIRHLL